jgi:4-amino-4-deoxy-L-arabinose transferase-like glycosyltransferase
LTEVASRPTQPPERPAGVRLRPQRLAPLALAAAYFALVGPTLDWLQFHDPIENLNVATALEIRRGGPWLVPTLQGVPRLAKPPLTAWITTAAIRPGTVAALDSTDAVVRAAAYDRLTWEVRWPALLAACLTLAATFELGRTLANEEDGDTFGLIAACVCATTLLFLRHCRLASTDGQLMLWVAVANLFLAKAVVRRKWWSGCLGAGAALGLVLMSKGPVGLAQTVLPFGCWVVLVGFRGTPGEPPGDTGFPARADDVGSRELRLSTSLHTRHGLEARVTGVTGIALGVLVTLLVGGWWYALVAARRPGAVSLWLSEVTRVEADELAPDPWYKHFASLHLFAPWLVWLAAGAVLALRELWARDRDRRRSPAVIALLLLLVPLLVMSLAKDRYQRYLAPLAPAGALLGAYALLEHRAGRPAGSRWAAWGRAAVMIHWLLLAAMTALVAVLASTGRFRPFLTVDGRPWFTPTAGAGLAAAALLAIGTGVLLHRRGRRTALVWATVLVMLVAQAVYVHGLGRSPSGRSALRPAAELIRERYPDAEVYVTLPNARNVISAGGNDLSIHLNRPIRWAAEPSAVPASARRQIWFTTRPKGAAEPEMPRGWSLLARVPGGETKYVFVRDRSK